MLEEGREDEYGLQLYCWDGVTIYVKDMFDSQSGEILAVLAAAVGTPGRTMEPLENGPFC